MTFPPWSSGAESPRLTELGDDTNRMHIMIIIENRDSPLFTLALKMSITVLSTSLSRIAISSSCFQPSLFPGSAAVSSGSNALQLSSHDSRARLYFLTKLATRNSSQQRGISFMATFLGLGE